MRAPVRDSDPARPVAWVTGASRGMGADTAIQLALAGYDVALTARDQARLEVTAEAVRAAGGGALPLASDLTDRRSIAAFADEAMATFGRCDVLCNIGIYQGPGARQQIMDTELDELATSFAADVLGPVLLCQRVIPAMIAQGGGTIVNMSSSSVVLDPPGTIHENGWSFAYVAAKAGIDRLASIINVELAAKGIRAFNVEPGFVAYGARFDDVLRKYPGVPVSPPESIGPAIVWLIRDPDGVRLVGKRVNLPGLSHKQGLVPGWDGPGSRFGSARG
jgi:NAD(P)-dependent dehydrogenase (short-subunit alcohol dehydrogenase family)